ncbi:hypothetical protein PCASD_17004 [Puccinia coronata f. sp. avenae]|uniref:Uncharacterized protein n=1 Tax=Puccinia coronata f. sp. avenae TaxID=200324 RepID=A0A2N5T9U5_9BASI|nr:hypothetical protein PCASD_17004 [Puccinia coronata f. sp. avenae]
MAGTQSSKKRRKANASSFSSVSSSSAQPSCNQRNKKIISLVKDSKDEPTPTKIDNPTDSTKPAKWQEMKDEQELRKALKAHWGILHPIVARNLPPRKAISANISRLYTAVQELLMESLKRHQGAMYLGLDVWQSPNGFDTLGTVIYCLVEQPGSGGKFELEAMPLEFVRLQQSHTGVYLAETVQLIVDKFDMRHCNGQCKQQSDHDRQKFKLQVASISRRTPMDPLLCSHPQSYCSVNPATFWMPQEEG